MLSAGYSSELNGRFNLYLDGGAGADSVHASVNLQAGSGGIFDGRALGGSENDELAFFLRDYSLGQARIYRATMDGGTGTDRNLARSAKVTAVSVEFDPYAPLPPGAGGGTVLTASR